MQACHQSLMAVLNWGLILVGSELKWGETKESEQRISSTYKVPIPPMTKVMVRIMATRGTCDVPFSYTQRDLLYNGETIVTEKDDGASITILTTLKSKRNQ